MKIYRVVLNYYSPSADEPGSASFILAARKADIAESYARASLSFQGYTDIELAYPVSKVVSLSGLMGELRKNPDRAVEIERTSF